MKEAYTRVLIGLIQLSTLSFPSNMKMAVADVIARAALWEVGLDYPHDTGSGIGAFLGVHECKVYFCCSRTFYFSYDYFRNILTESPKSGHGYRSNILS